MSKYGYKGCLGSNVGGPDRALAAKRRLLGHTTTPALLTHKGEAGRVGLEEQLKVYTADDADPMPPALMQKYIAYARAYVQPVLSEAAKKVLPLSSNSTVISL